VAKKLDRAKSRLLEVPSDMVDVIAEKIHEVQDHLDVIDEEIRRASITPKDIIGEFDAKMDWAVEMIDNLVAIFKNHPHLAREFLMEAVEEVRLDVSRRKAGSRYRYKLDGGELFLRRDVILFSSW